ncbi:MAG: head-tail adaptor protein [Pseudomonadota bacterium]
MKRLSRKLELEALTRVDDGAGGFVGNWTALGTHWGAVDATSGRLERGEAQPRSRVAYRITVRAVPPSSSARPKAGQRFREGARLYAIRAVLQSADARYLSCIVDEELAS